MLKRLLSLSTLCATALAQSWYTVEWDAPQFTSLSGDMIVPDLPAPGGTPYVWPGVQSGNGVLQAVLDGRSGTWWIGDGFYGTPSLPWGSGFNVAPGDTVHLTFDLSGDSTWTCTLESNGQTATTTLDITGNTMNRFEGYLRSRALWCGLRLRARRVFECADYRENCGLGLVRQNRTPRRLSLHCWQHSRLREYMHDVKHYAEQCSLRCSLLSKGRNGSSIPKIPGKDGREGR